MEIAFITLIGGAFIGVLGGLLGVGGGVFLIPFLVGVLGIAPIEAVGLSLFCVIGTSVGSSSRALKSTDINIGLGFIIEVCMVAGSVFASLIADKISGPWLLRLFGMLTSSLALLFFIRVLKKESTGNISLATGESHWLDGESAEPGQNAVHYRPKNPKRLALLVFGSGMASGLFGIGGGMLNVPLFTFLGGMPLRAAAATSTFAMALTGAAGASIYFSRGLVPLFLAVPLLLGVIPGGSLGMRLQSHLSTRQLRLLFALLAAAVGVWSFWRSAKGGGS